jgi:hypothetical protein
MRREISVSGIIPSQRSLAKVVQRHRNFILRKGFNFVSCFAVNDLDTHGGAWRAGGANANIKCKLSTGLMRRSASQTLKVCCHGSSRAGFRKRFRFESCETDLDNFSEMMNGNDPRSYQLGQNNPAMISTSSHPNLTTRTWIQQSRIQKAIQGNQTLMTNQLCHAQTQTQALNTRKAICRI